MSALLNLFSPMTISFYTKLIKICHTDYTANKQQLVKKNREKFAWGKHSRFVRPVLM